MRNPQVQSFYNQDNRTIYIVKELNPKLREQVLNKSIFEFIKTNILNKSKNEDERIYSLAKIYKTLNEYTEFKEFVDKVILCQNLK